MILSCTVFVTKCTSHLNIPLCVETCVENADISTSEFHTMIFSAVSSFVATFRLSLEFDKKEGIFSVSLAPCFERELVKTSKTFL